MNALVDMKLYLPIILFVGTGCISNSTIVSKSYSPHRCEYFVAEIGNEFLNQSHIHQNSLSETVATNSNIIREKVYLNSAADAWRDAQTSGYIGGGFTGFEAANLAGSSGRITPKCSREEMKAGWFDPADLTNNYSPLIVDLAATVNGKTYEVYTAYSPDTELRYKFRKPIFQQHVSAAREKAYLLLMEQVNEDQPAN